MHFNRTAESASESTLDEAVNHEIVGEALRIAAQKHAAAHKKGEHFALHVIEEHIEGHEGQAGSALSQKQPAEKRVSGSSYDQVSDKYDPQFHADTLANCMIGCDCGWRALASEFLKEEFQALHASDKQGAGNNSQYGNAGNAAAGGYNKHREPY